MQSIKNLKKIKGKTILLRVDFNVPFKINKILKGKEINDYTILDDFRIKKAIPTVKYLVKRGAKVIIITHLSKGENLGLLPIEKKFFKLSKLSKEKVSFLPNIRNSKEEEKNDLSFAKKLSELGDIFVNDAFSVSHRAHTSLVGIPKYLPSYAGFQLEEEINNLSFAFKNPKKPFLFILGGAKFSTKIPLIEKYIKLAHFVFIGGALANDFLKAKGWEVGKSLIDKKPYNIQKFLNNKKLILPTDVIVSSKGKLSNKKIGDVEKSDVIIDIGRETTRALVDLIKKSKTIVWNGPLGKYEDGGDRATKEILRRVAKVSESSETKSILGGGDTVALISKLGIEKKFSFVSTGGGATLEFLSKGTLPAIEALG